MTIFLNDDRYEKQLQSEEEAYQQARRRLYQEVQDEKERLAQASIRQRQEMDKLQRQLEDSHSSSSDLMKREYEKAREEQERRHQVCHHVLLLCHNVQCVFLWNINLFYMCVHGKTSLL